MAKKKNRKKKKNSIFKANTMKEFVYLDPCSNLHIICNELGLLDFTISFIPIFKKISLGVDFNSKNWIHPLIDNLEKLMSDILSDTCYYDMLFYSRRLFPRNIFKCPENEIPYYRQIMNLAFLKYCKKESPNNVVEFLDLDGKNSIYPSHMEFFDVSKMQYLFAAASNFKGKIECIGLDTETYENLTFVAKLFRTCYRIEAYAFYHTYLIKEFRSAIKGATVCVHEEYGIGVESSSELVEKFSLIDKRQHYSSYLSSLGASANINFDTSDPLKIPLLTYIENTGRNNSIEYINMRIAPSNMIMHGSQFITNYLPQIINIYPYYKFALCYKNEFYLYYGFNIEDLLVLLMVLNHTGYTSTHPFSIVHMLQRAYSIWDYDTLKSHYNYEYDFFLKMLDPSLSKKELFSETTFDRILEHLLYTDTYCTELKLKYFGPLRMLSPITENRLIYYGDSCLHTLEHLLSPISLEDISRGEKFENAVAQYILDNMPNVCIWHVNRKIKCKKGERELDVSFIYKDTLILVECKAINVRVNTYFGDENSIRHRQMKLEQAINQTDKTFNFIIENIEYIAPKIPSNISAILSIIVTPMAEYTWELNDSTMLTPEVPRIMTLEELLLIPGILDNGGLEKKTFYKTI